MTEEVFIARQSRAKLLGFFMMVCGFVLVGLLGLGTFGESPFDREPDQAGRVIIWLCAAFFGFCAAKILRQLLEGGAALQIDHLGIHFKKEGILVPWEHVTTARRYVLKIPSGWIIPVRQKCFVFDVSPEYRREFRGFKKALAFVDRKMTKAEYTVTPVGLDQSLEQIVDGFNRFAPNRLKVVSE